MRLSTSPIAIIKTADRQLEFVKIKKIHNKFFATQNGIFEIDDRYEYRWKKTPIYFYNFANSKPISLNAMDEITAHLNENNEKDIPNLLSLEDEIGNHPEIDVTKIDFPKKTNFSKETDNFLQHFQTDDEDAKTDVMLQSQAQKKPIKKYSANLIGIGANFKDYAIIKIGKRELDIVPMTKYDDKVYTKYGIFFVFKQHMYMHKKQIICIFVLSDTQGNPMAKLGKSEQRQYKDYVVKRKFGEDYISVFQKIKNKTWSLIQKIPLKQIQESKPKVELPPLKIPTDDSIKGTVSLSTERSLGQWVADVPSVFHTTLKELYADKEAVETNLGDVLKKGMPLIVIMAGLMGLMIVMSNAGTIIDKIGEVTGMTPEIIIVTEEEAIERGLIDDPDLAVDEADDDPPPDYASTEEVEIPEKPSFDIIPGVVPSPAQ